MTTMTNALSDRLSETRQSATPAQCRFNTMQTGESEY